MRIQLSHIFEDVVSIDNLLLAWQEFLRGKRNKKDVQEFQFHLMNNILSLYYDLSSGSYRHGGYQEFRISDPKPRIIHKATVRDRLVHHAVYRILYPFFDTTFIADSFSCRNSKGTHKAMNRFRQFAYQVGKNNTTTCWVLKCDIKKFFASIDQGTLLAILSQRVPDKYVFALLKEIISSFHSGTTGKGLPLGNLTSQLFANVYMNEFDQFVKHQLKVKHYIRYADDFVVLSKSRHYLETLVHKIRNFLMEALLLELHQDKIITKTLSSGLDFLGWVHFFDHRILRNPTRKRMFKKLLNASDTKSLNSYLGLISHGNSYKMREKLKPYEDEIKKERSEDCKVN